MRYRFTAFTLVGVILCATVGLALTFSAGGAVTTDTLSHCKSPSHLFVRSRPVKRIEVPVSVTYVAAMQCHNNPTYASWGLVISVRPKHPLEGLHLYPETATWLVGMLVGVANVAPGGNLVTIFHTTRSTFSEFVSLTPAAALDLAAAIQGAEPPCPSSSSS